jgi:hypothetical protein
MRASFILRPFLPPCPACTIHLPRPAPCPAMASAYRPFAQVNFQAHASSIHSEPIMESFHLEPYLSSYLSLDVVSPGSLSGNSSTDSLECKSQSSNDSLGSPGTRSV